MPEGANSSQLPAAIEEIALALHQTQSRNLSSAGLQAVPPIPQTDSELWTSSDGQVEFASLASRNICASSAAFHQLRNLQKHTDERALFEAANDLLTYEIGHEDLASGRLLGLVSKSVNILASATRLIQAGVDTFDILHAVEASLPYLDKITTSDLIALVESQHPKTENDLAAGFFFNSVQRYLEGKPSLAWSLYEELKPTLTETNSNLYSSTLLSLITSPEQEDAINVALEDARSKDPQLAAIAVWTIGCALRSATLVDGLRANCKALLVEAATDQVEQIRQNSQRAIAHAAGTQSDLVSLTFRLADSEDQFQLAVLANFMIVNLAEIKSHESFPACMRALAKIGANSQGSLRKFDLTLRKLVEDEDHSELVFECLTEWVAKHGSGKLSDRNVSVYFEHTLGMLSKNEASLSSLLTRWLLSEDRRHAVACGGLISFLWVRGIRQPKFSQDELKGRDAADFLLLVRRMLGYVISEEPLLSLTLSLLDLEAAKERTYGLVHHLLSHEIGRDYAQETMEAIATRIGKASSAEKAMLDSASKRLNGYIDAIEKLPRLQELRSPLHLRRSIALRRSRDMQRSIDAANERSTLRQLVTEIPLKAGVGWFAVTDGQVTPTHHLQSISQQVCLPRRSMTDPIGYAIAGMYFRLAKRGDE